MSYLPVFNNKFIQSFIVKISKIVDKFDYIDLANKWSISKIIPRKMVIGSHFDERLLSVCLPIQAPPPKSIA